MRILPHKKFLNFWVSVLVVLSTLQALSGAESSLTDEITRFSIDWDTYQYKVKTTMNINEAISLNERYYMRSQVRELILKKISTGIENLYVDNRRKIMDILDENLNFRREYPVYLQSINAIRLIFKKSEIEASTMLPLRGESGLLARIPLPWGTMKYAHMEEPEYVGEAYRVSKVGREYNSGLIPIKYSGLIVDLRGMEISEALAPRIFTQTGQLFYGPEFISQKLGVQRGIVSYATDINDPEVKIRAGDSPYYTVALSSRGFYNTDIVLSSQDMDKITQHMETLENLQKCRVIFLIDEKKD
jgi:hypothetical protein